MSLICCSFLSCNIGQGAKKFPDGQKTMLGKSITFPTTNRHHSGVYECTAENSEGEPSKAIINLQITCELGRRLGAFRRPFITAVAIDRRRIFFFKFKIWRERGREMDAGMHFNLNS